MIDKFSVLYVGNIDLENVGSDGTPADRRRYPSERLAESLETAAQAAELMDELGFYALWMAEHHFQHEGYECIPNIILLGTHLASRTEKLKFGCAFNIVPMWHPIRLAEDYAMADILTDGRIIFGVGRGYHSREVESLGSPVIDNDANRELFEEQMEIIFKAFNQESFSHQGKRYSVPARVEYRGYDLEEVTLVPRPKHLPVEMWQPIVSGRTIDFIAKNGVKGVVALTGETLVEQIFQQYRDANAKHGQELALGENLALGVGFYLADSQEEAMERLRPYHDERYKWFAPFGFVRYADEQGRTWGTPGAPARTPYIEDGVQQKAWFCGRAEDFIAFLKDLGGEIPGSGAHNPALGRGNAARRVPGSAEIRFAREVMPVFTNRS